MPDVNITEVHLVSVALENDYRHTLFFEDAAAQESYFQWRIRDGGITFNDFSYQRKDGYIRVPVHYDQVMGRYNYVVYRNNAYKNADGTSKWFYAFITDMQYKDDGRTDIFIETDVMQTWLFEHKLQDSFIEREHCIDDTPGLNTQPEDLETGEYITNVFSAYSPSRDEYMETGVVDFIDGSICDIIIASTVDATKATTTNDEGASVYPNVVGGNIYNGVYSGVKYFQLTKNEANSFISKLAKTGQSDAIQSVFLFPSALKYDNPSNTEVMSSNTIHSTTWKQDDLPTHYICRPTTVNKYTPKNNKVLTYPYCYLMVSNNNGSDVVYRYEFFEYSTNDLSKQACDFKIYSAITPGGSIRAVPLKYGGENENLLMGVTAGKYPICCWATDVYTNWLTQQSMNLDIASERGGIAVRSAILNQAQAITDGAMGVAQYAAQGNIVGVGKSATGAAYSFGHAELARQNGLLDIKAVTAQKYQQSMTPPESRGTLNSGDVIYGMDKATFTAYHKSIRKEYAQIIDKYFDMYGYATNLVKTPNMIDPATRKMRAYRESYWFIKTIAANVDGAIPNKDLNIIKRCYNNGITFWKSDKGVGNYSHSNNIV